MKSYRMLAWKEILEQKTVSILILTAVVLSAMMTAAVGQSVGVLSAMREQQAAAIGGNRYATFVQLTEEQAQMVERDDRLANIGRAVVLGSMELNDLLHLDIAEYWNGGMETQPSCSRLVEGRLPEGPMEIALPEDALQFLGFTGEIGDTIPLSLSKALRHGVMIEAYDYRADFVLTGIMESNYMGYTNGSIMGLAGKGTAEAVLPPEYLYYNVDVKTVDKKHFQTVIEEIGSRLQLHELDILYNGPYLRALGIRYDGAEEDSGMSDEGFSYLILVGVLVVVLVLTAAGLVIYNILKIAVVRRIGGYGVLRAIGAEKGQLYGIVAKEMLLLCAFGIPVGMLLGILAAKGILTAALHQLPAEIFLAQDMEQLQELIAENVTGKRSYLLLSAFIPLFFAFLAAAPAVRFAAEVSPVAAICGNTGGKIKRKNRKKRNIRRFERYYARLNLQRNKGRTAITILSLVMSITVFITLQGVLSLISVAGEESEHLGDYSVVNEYSGFSPEELAKMEAGQAVEAVAAQQFSLYELDAQFYPVGIDTDFALGIAETLQIFGWNNYWMDSVFSGRLTEEQLRALKAGEGCIVRNPLPLEIEGKQIGKTHIEEGSVITIAGQELPVILSMSGYDGYFSVGSSGFINGVQVIMSDCLYPRLTGTDAYAELRPVMKADADRAAFDRMLDDLGERTAGTVWISYEQADRQVEESEAQIRMLAWGLILFIGLIGILNIINTVYTNIHTRVKEIGIQRAIGMSVGSLYKTFLWEGVYYGLTASLLGSITGYLGVILTEAAASGTLALAAVPMGSIMASAACSVAACLLATAIPLRRISGLSIVEAATTVV